MVGKVAAAVISASTPRIISANMLPAHTGRASVSLCNCLAVPEVDTSECQPDTAPQASVTNRMGQIGPISMMGLVKAGMVKVGCPTNTPIPPSTSPRKTT